MKPSTSWSDYDVPVTLPPELIGKVSFDDLMEKL